LVSGPRKSSGSRELEAGHRSAAERGTVPAAGTVPKRRKGQRQLAGGLKIRRYVGQPQKSQRACWLGVRNDAGWVTAVWPTDRSTGKRPTADDEPPAWPTDTATCD